MFRPCVSLFVAMLQIKLKRNLLKGRGFLRHKDDGLLIIAGPVKDIASMIRLDVYSALVSRACP